MMPTWLFLGLSMVVIGPFLGVLAQALLRSPTFWLLLGFVLLILYHG
jgi:hypothetical protein